MRSLLFNLIAARGAFDADLEAQLTFHLGDDQYGLNPKFSDYEDCNIAQAENVVATLARDPEKAKRLADFIAVHEIGARAIPEAIPQALSI